MKDEKKSKQQLIDELVQLRQQISVLSAATSTNRQNDEMQYFTEYKQAEKALRLSEERFSKAFNSSPNPMAVSTIEEGRFLFVNDNFKTTFGYKQNEIIGNTEKAIGLWFVPEERAQAIRILHEQGFVRNMEIGFRDKAGETHTGLLSAEILSFDDKRYMLSVFNDITEQKRLEKEVALLDRLHLVGEMAAGIGHEIRNPMTTIRGFLQLISEKEEHQILRGYFGLMIEELDRANAIITEFLSLAGNKVREFERKNINTIVETLFPLMQADALKTDKLIIAELGLIPDLPLNEKEIRQLILNLARNGLEAMSPKSHLTIRTYSDGEEIVLAVKDQGEGIEPAILEKIGTPFFTTKEQGTGIGLAVCFSIVSRHNAKIDIDTGPGGTTFFVRFKI